MSEQVEKELSLTEKIIFIPLYGIVLVTMLFIVYLSMSSLVSLILPFILNMFVKTITDSKTGDIRTFLMTVSMAISFFPILSLLISIIIQLVTSFFSDLWKNLNFTFIITSIQTNMRSKNSNSCWLLFQLLMFLFVIVFLFGFLMFEFMMSTVQWSGFVLILFGISPALYGIGSVFFKAWFCMFRSGNTQETNEKDAKSLELSIFSEEDKDSSAEDGKCFDAVIPIELIDPASLRNQKDWISVLEDPTTNDFKIGCNLKWRRLIGVLVLLLSLYTITYSLIVVFKKKDYIMIAYPILVLFALPFIVVCNFSTVLGSKDRFEGKGNAWLSMIITFVFYSMILLVVIIFSVFQMIWKPHQVTALSFVDASNTSQYVLNYRPALCSTSFPGGLNMIQSVGLTMLPRLFETTSEHTKLRSGKEGIFNSTMKYLFGIDYELNPLSISTLNKYQDILYAYHENSPEYAYIVFGGIENQLSWCLYLETLVSLYTPMILSAVIPFFSILMGISPGPITLASSASIALFLLPLHQNIIASIYNILVSLKDYGITPTLIGHSTGGFFVKELMKLGGYGGLAIEGIQTEGMSLGDSSLTSGRTLFTDKMTNIFSAGSLFGAAEQLFMNNFQFPNPNPSWKPTSIYESFCLIAAQCATDDRFVPLCTQVLSSDTVNGTEEFLRIRHLLFE